MVLILFLCDILLYTIQHSVRVTDILENKLKLYVCIYIKRVHHKNTYDFTSVD